MRNAFYSLVNFINSADETDVYVQAAKIILKNINEIPNLTITEVAVMTYSSTSTISRLCRKLNYESFAEFKKDCTVNINFFNHDTERLNFDFQLPSKESFEKEGKKVFESHFDNIINNLKETYENISYEDIEEIVDEMHKCQKVYFLGNYLTQSIAMQLQIELSYLHKNTEGRYNIAQQKEMVKRMTKDDVLILTSIAGSYFQTQKELMREIAKSPAYKVVITQDRDFETIDTFDKKIIVGNNHQSLVGKFSITYVFEILEAIYHLKYSK
ncbi:MAG: MurR/RpiR family transcriptional regulator [Thomasclavelia sp.]|nr:MurR/RpiR family transcriptional regulator [Thomasclavelia sp.]